MNEIEFDQALSVFLDSEGCEKTNEALFELVRSAFTAGWKEALGSDIGKVMRIAKREERGE